VEPDSATASSAFDAHHPPPREILDTCVHCGFCLPTCPTYVLTGQEMESPRGRIYLMHLAADGAATMTADWVRHLDSCLGCVSCTTACPSGVDYGTLIEATRGQIARGYERPWLERTYRRVLFGLLTRPARLAVLRRALSAYQTSGLQTLVRRIGLLSWLPNRMKTMEALAPQVEKPVALPEVTPAIGRRRARVGLMLGCVQRELLSSVNAATARVLAADGYEVVTPSAQPCCGALLMHAGEEDAACQRAREMVDAFERSGVDLVVTNAGGCGSHVKHYGRLLADDPAYASKGAAFAAKCRDVSEMLAADPKAPRHPLPLIVAYHDSCHLQHAQRVRLEPRALLAAIPGVTLVDVPEAAICCGSAGIYNLVQPETADVLGDRKASLIAPLRVNVVATGNPGCILQIGAALRRRGLTIPVVHTIEIVDASIRGVSDSLASHPASRH
jgi:glycolate oxidase iron-sulfur subunit